MKRTFLAFDIAPSETLSKVYEQVRQELHNEKITWVDSGNLHITVKFLGDTEEDSIAALIGKASDVMNGHKPFRVRLKGLGVFRNIYDPRVIWIGCEIEESLGKLREKLNLAFREFGFEAEKRSFSPHLTLGRIKITGPAGKLGKLVTTYKDHIFQELTISELIFYESTLTPSGPVYTPLHRFSL